MAFNIAITTHLTNCRNVFNVSNVVLDGFINNESKTYRVLFTPDNDYYTKDCVCNCVVTGNKYNDGVGSYTCPISITNRSIEINFTIEQDRYIRVGSQSNNKFLSITAIDLTIECNTTLPTSDETIDTTNTKNVSIIAGGFDFNLSATQQIYVVSDTPINDATEWITKPYLMYDNNQKTCTDKILLTGGSNINVCAYISLNATQLGGYPQLTLYGVGVSSSSLNITNNLQNASCNNLVFDKSSQTNSYTITPAQTYYFDTLPYLRITTSGVNVDLQFTLSNGVYVLTVDGTQYNNADSVSVNGVAISDSITINTTQLVNGSLSSNLFDTTTTNTITATPTTNYSFVKNCKNPKITISYGNNKTTEISFILENNVWSVTIDATQYNNISGVAVSGRAYPDNEIYDIDLSQLENIHLTADSCDKIIYQHYVYIECRVDAGYILDGDIKLALYSSGAGYQTLTYNAQKDVYSCEEMDFNQTGRYLIGRAVMDTPLISNYGAIRAYKPTNAQLRQLVDKRFYNVDTHEYEDLANYILSFVRYPFTVSTSNSSSVKFGFFDTQINVDLAEQQTYTLSLGRVLVSGLYGNSSDIDKCDITILLPYADNYHLESKYINTYIECVYKIDILANTAVIEIYSNDKLIDSISTSIGYDIPYILKTDRVTPVNINLQSNILKAKDPKIIVRQRAKVANTYYKTLKRQVLNNLSGYNKIDNVVLSISNKMTLAEQNEIKNLLAGGVYA